MSIRGSLETRLLHAAVATKLKNFDYGAEPEGLLIDRSIICIGNNVCSLDSWIACDLTRGEFRRQFLRLGEASVLASYPFLRQFGVWPVTSGGPMTTMWSLTEVGRALRTRADIMAWVFPTGKHSLSHHGVDADLRRVIDRWHVSPGRPSLFRWESSIMYIDVHIQIYPYELTSAHRLVRRA